ncbi:exoribonuclease R [Citrobacter freundii]|nr:exoribonuclease R [Citrobacter freundii]
MKVKPRVKKRKKGDAGKNTAKRRQMGKKVNFEPDSAFRGEKKGRAKPPGR